MSLRNKIELYNSTSLINMGSEESEELLYFKLELTNFELFKANTKAQADTYPSAFALIKNLPHSAAKNVTLHHLSQTNFPVLMYKIKDLVSFGVTLLRTSEFGSNYFSQSSLTLLLKKIALRYNGVAYHNFSHAFSLALVLLPLFSSTISAWLKNQLCETFSRRKNIFIFLSQVSPTILITVNNILCRGYKQCF